MNVTLTKTRLEPDVARRRVRSMMLLGGCAAGPLFVGLSVLQGATRHGFSFADHPPSALSNGGFGWLQIANFVVAGGLYAAAGVSLRRTLDGVGAMWGSRLITLFGLALAVAGVFPMDPAFGFPPGTADGVPDHTTLAGAIHGMAFPIGFGALVAAGFVFARRYKLLGRRRARWLSTLCAPTALVLAGISNTGGAEGRFMALWAAVVIAFAWCSTVLYDVRAHGAAAR